MKNSKAYTLVEMSIVLVIIGLLVGGVLSGRSLIHGAELRRFADFGNQFNSSFYLFRQKYDQLPGDMPNATQFWGTSPSGRYVTQFNICGAAGGIPTGTCNGNGDGFIGYYQGESQLMWEHLKLAGIIDYPINDPNNYSQTQAAGLTKDVFAFVANNDAPPHSGDPFNATFTNYTDMIYYMDFFGGDSATPMPNAVPGKGIGLILAGFGDMYHDTMGAVISPIDMWNIDAKMDDGLPDHGKVMGSNGGVGVGQDWTNPLAWTTTCVTNASGTWKYDLTESNRVCRAMFVIVQR